LHGDLYFSILEWLKHRAGLAPGDRSLQPGQIVPDIRTEAAPARMRITLSDVAPEEKIQPGPADLEDADRPLTPAQIIDALAELGGKPSLSTTLITEYPNETIYGDAFRLAHRTQMRTVLAAITLYRASIRENGRGGAGISMAEPAICGQRQKP
jgi:hypothetical protein